MTSRKSARTYFEYPLTPESKQKISVIINDNFDRFLKHNIKFLNDKDREHLRRLAVDQLSEYMSELSDEKTRWNLDGSVITIRIQSKLENISRHMLENMSPDELEKYRFVQRSNRWELVYDDDKELGINYSDFSKQVYSQMFEAAGTAAFYAVESWFKEN